MYKLLIKSLFLAWSLPLFCAQEQTNLALPPTSKKLNQSFNNLCLDLQIYTLRFLMDFEIEIDDITGALIITRDANVPFKGLMQKIQPADLFDQPNLTYMKEILRTEYFYRTVFISIQADFIYEKELNRISLCSDESQLLFETLGYYHSEHLYNHGNEKQDYLEFAALLITNGALVGKSKTEVFHALYKAAKHNSVPVVQLLIKAGVSKSNTSITNKNALDSALHIAAKHNSLDVILYLNSLHDNLDDQNRSGQTALHKASKYRHQESVDLLLALGADPTIKNSYDQTYLTIPKIKK